MSIQELSQLVAILDRLVQVQAKDRQANEYYYSGAIQALLQEIKLDAAKLSQDEPLPF